jgi:hypothetical protein
MAYIIENINLLKETSLQSTSILINNGRIEHFMHSVRKHSLMRMNGTDFIMTPPHLIYDPQIPVDKDFLHLKQYYINEFIKKGSTVFLTHVAVSQEYLLKKSLAKMKTNLLNSPIDFIIGVKIPVHLLTPSLVRKCKREKVPVIFVEVDDVSEFCKIPWGWIKEAMFPYNSPLVPIFNNGNTKKHKLMKDKWNNILSEEKIPFVKEEIPEKMPLPKSVLCKIGVYPKKLAILQGSEVSYNLYWKMAEVNKIEESELFLYHNHRLVVTVHKGTVIRAGEEVLYRPGFGELMLIKTPGFYAEISTK